MKTQILSQKAFTAQINRLLVEWPSAFKGERLARIYSAVSDVPDYAFEEIANGMLDNFRTAPLPSDFHKASAEWHKRYFSKHGKFYHDQHDHEVIDVVPIKCAQCSDFGFIQITLKNNGFQTILRCDCIEGKLQNDEYLPQWQPYFRDWMEISKCPLEWFRPKEFVTPDSDKKDKHFFTSLQKNIDVWQAKKKFAKDFWHSFLPTIKKHYNRI